jgi:hypothetical protein
MQRQRSESVRRWIVIGLLVAAVAGLLYAANAIDLIGMLPSMHAPPEGVH